MVLGNKSQVLDDETARAQALESADRLFAERGITAVGMDDIRDASGVSLKRLYRLFDTKEGLAEEALALRKDIFLAALRDSAERRADPREKLLAVFDYLAEWFREDGYRGCPFTSAYAEVGAQSAGVAAAVQAQKRELHDLLGALVEDAGGDPALAAHLALIANGAMVSAAILDPAAAGAEAKAAARLAVEASGIG
jgi:AcrR family transcriptional regulator